MSTSRYMSQRGGGHVNMSSYSSSTSSSSSSSRIRSSTSPVLSNSSFGSLDYFASPFETPAPPRSSPDRNSELRIKYASFSDTPVMTFPVPQLHLGSQVQSPASPAPSTSSTSSTAESDLHGVGLAALAVPVSPSSPTSFVSPGPSHSEFRPTPDMRKKLALHRRTVLFPEARVVNWARPFRAQGHAQPHVRQVSQDLLPSPQFDLEDLCQEAFQMKPVDMALFGASSQRQRRLRNASPSLSPASTDSSAGPLTPDATPPMSDSLPQLSGHEGTWQIGFEGKGLGIDKVQHGLHRLSWTDPSKPVSPTISTPGEAIEIEEILLNDDPVEDRNSYIATGSILDDYAEKALGQVTASTSTPTIGSPRNEPKVKESITASTVGSNQFEYSSLLSSSSMASLDAVPTTMSELQQMRQAAESLMNSLRTAQSTAIARARSSDPDQVAPIPSPARARVASSSRRKAVPTINVECESEANDSEPASSGQSTPAFEQDLASPLPRSASSPTIRKGFYALRAAAQSVPVLSPSTGKRSLPTSPTTSSSSHSDASTSQLHTPTTPVFPGGVSLSPASIEVKQVAFQIHIEPSGQVAVPAELYGGYLTRSQRLALQEQEKRDKESKEAKTRRGLARFFKSSP